MVRSTACGVLVCGAVLLSCVNRGPKPQAGGEGLPAAAEAGQAAEPNGLDTALPPDNDADDTEVVFVDSGATSDDEVGDILFADDDSALSLTLRKHKKEGNQPDQVEPASDPSPNQTTNNDGAQPSPDDAGRQAGRDKVRQFLKGRGAAGVQVHRGLAPPNLYLARYEDGKSKRRRFAVLETTAKGVRRIQLTYARKGAEVDPQSFIEGRADRLRDHPKKTSEFVVMRRQSVPSGIVSTATGFIDRSRIPHMRVQLVAQDSKFSVLQVTPHFVEADLIRLERRFRGQDPAVVATRLAADYPVEDLYNMLSLIVDLLEQYNKSPTSVGAEVGDRLGTFGEVMAQAIKQLDPNGAKDPT